MSGEPLLPNLSRNKERRGHANSNRLSLLQINSFWGAISVFSETTATFHYDLETLVILYAVITMGSSETNVASSTDGLRNPRHSLKPWKACSESGTLFICREGISCRNGLFQRHLEAGIQPEVSGDIVLTVPGCTEANQSSRELPLPHDSDHDPKLLHSYVPNCVNWMFDAWEFRKHLNRVRHCYVDLHKCFEAV